MGVHGFLNVGGYDHLGEVVRAGDRPRDPRLVYVEVPDALMERWHEASKAKTQAEIEIMFHTMTREQYEAWARSPRAFYSGSPWIALRYHLAGAWNAICRLARGTVDDEGRRHRLGWLFSINGVAPWRYCGAASRSHPETN